MPLLFKQKEKPINDVESKKEVIPITTMIEVCILKIDYLHIFDDKFLSFWSKDLRN